MGFYYKQVPDGSYCLTGYQGNDKHVTMPENIRVSILGDYLFKNHTEIESIELPDTITQLGGFVFDGCTNLKSITLPESLVDMWQYALTRTYFEEIVIPGSIKEIIPFTFNQSQVQRVYIKEGTKKIDAWAFKDCKALTDVYLPSTIEKISDNAFAGCGNINFHKK